ncbi:radical SAM/SPASM domain-containing protein [Stella sp.]|uniref:radical SAM/SPASM domain-containing protein n=1 Tax=Stella sp. TaxID=2912054 RepID=UPI0035AE4AC0
MASSITQRIDAITAIAPDWRRCDPPVPRSVKIELTARCNFACSFCARSARLRDQRDMDRALFERLLLEMRRAGVEEIGLFYLGESFLCSWLEEAIAFAKDECGFPYVFLTTNGSLATPGRLEGCFRAGLDSLKFSFNYADVEQFSAVARVKAGLFRKMIANIVAAHAVRDRVAEETGRRCGLYASYIEYDGEQRARMAESVDAVRPYVDEVYALPLYNQADLVTAEEKALGWQPTAGNRGRVGALREAIPCWSIFTEGHITWDGRLSACCFDHDGRFHMADLTRTPFAEGWNSDRFQSLRRAHLARRLEGTPCATCVVLN